MCFLHLPSEFAAARSVFDFVFLVLFVGVNKNAACGGTSAVFDRFFTCD